MSEINYCPTCTDPLSPGSDSCACGWKRPENEQKTEKQKNSNRKHLCEWSGMGKECPALGVHSTNTTGATQWYCFPHLTAQGLTDGVKVIEDYEKNGLPDRISNSQKIVMNAMREGNGLTRKPGESMQDFKRRIVAQSDKAFKRFS